MKTAAIYVRVQPPTSSRKPALRSARACGAAWLGGRAGVSRLRGLGRRARRPGLDALIADARQKKFSVVLVAAFDRVARSVKHFLQVMDEFDSLGVVFIPGAKTLTPAADGTSLPDADWHDCRTRIGLDSRARLGWHAKGEARRCADRTCPDEHGSSSHRPRPT